MCPGVATWDSCLGSGLTLKHPWGEAMGHPASGRELALLPNLTQHSSPPCVLHARGCGPLSSLL